MGSVKCCKIAFDLDLIVSFIKHKNSPSSNTQISSFVRVDNSFNKDFNCLQNNLTTLGFDNCTSSKVEAYQKGNGRQFSFDVIISVSVSKGFELSLLIDHYA